MLLFVFSIKKNYENLLRKLYWRLLFSWGNSEIRFAFVSTRRVNLFVFKIKIRRVCVWRLRKGMGDPTISANIWWSITFRLTSYSNNNKRREYFCAKIVCSTFILLLLSPLTVPSTFFFFFVVAAVTVDSCCSVSNWLGNVERRNHNRDRSMHTVLCL